MQANLTDSIASFLIAASPCSYYSASTGWFDRDWTWHQQYDLLYGVPTGVATRRVLATGETEYIRRYTRCNVTLICGHDGRCEGTFENRTAMLV